LDCWDKRKSDYINDPILGGENDNDKYYEVLKFSLNEDMLGSIPLEERLLFKMGGALNAMLTCHESIKPLEEY